MNLATTPYITYLLIGICILIALWLVVTYNKFISLKRFKDDAWSGVSIQLKRRHDLLPNLLSVVTRYAEHEKSVFENITQQRAKMANSADNIQQITENEKQFTTALGRVFAITEANPELKSNENFIVLQNTLSDVEEQLQLARRYFNGTVRDLNILIESFPSLIVAKLFKFKTAEFFELDNPTEAKVPSMS